MAVRNCSTENIIEERLDRPIFLHFCDWMSLPDSMLFTLGFILIPQQMGRNRKAHTPSKWIQFIHKGSWTQSHSSDISFFFQAPLHTTVSLRFPEHRFFLSFFITCSTFLENLDNRHLSPAYHFLTYKWIWKFLLLSFTNSCEGHLRKLIWRANDNPSLFVI